MSKLSLSVAIGDYDRNRPLIDGAVRIDGVDPVFMTLSPEEIFFRALRTYDFDICELSLSSFTVKTAAGNNPYVGIPCFVSRAFRHTSIYVRTDRIKEPEGPQGAQGRRAGISAHRQCMGARHPRGRSWRGKPADIRWVRGAIEHAGRIEKITIKLPPGVALENAPEGRTISDLIDKGEIDGFIAPRPPHLPRPNPNVGWLFRDPVAAAKDYFKRTGIFPIMHLVGVRRTLVEQHPWLPVAVMKAFEQSKAAALAHLRRHLGHQGDAAVRRGADVATRELMGDDYWPYGLEPNRKALETFLRHHHAQGLSSRLVTAGGAVSSLRPTRRSRFDGV